MRWILTVALLALAIVYALVCWDTFPTFAGGIRPGYFRTGPLCNDCGVAEIVSMQSRLFIAYVFLTAYTLRLLTAVWLTPQRLRGMLRFFILLGIMLPFLAAVQFRHKEVVLAVQVAVWVLMGICLALEKRYTRDPLGNLTRHQRFILRRKSA